MCLYEGIKTSCLWCCRCVVYHRSLYWDTLRASEYPAWLWIFHFFCRIVHFFCRTDWKWIKWDILGKWTNIFFPFLYARLQTGRIMVWWCPSVRPSGSPSARFPHFSPKCFDILSWNFAHDFVLMYYRSSSSVVTLRQFLKELCLFVNLEYR